MVALGSYEEVGVGDPQESNPGFKVLLNDVTSCRKNAGSPAQRMGQTSSGARLDEVNTLSLHCLLRLGARPAEMVYNLVSCVQPSTGGGVRLFHIQLACTCMLLLFLLGLGMRARLLHEWASHGFADEEEYSRSEHFLSLIGLVSAMRHQKYPCGEDEIYHTTPLSTWRPMSAGQLAHCEPRNETAACDFSRFVMTRGPRGAHTSLLSPESVVHGQASLSP